MNSDLQSEEDARLKEELGLLVERVQVPQPFVALLYRLIGPQPGRTEASPGSPAYSHPHVDELNDVRAEAFEVSRSPLRRPWRRFPESYRFWKQGTSKNDIAV